jgi:carboxylesterase type B
MRSLSLLWILGTVAHAASASASVDIPNGTVHGVVDNCSGVEKFLGIPFAEPPVGDRRLRRAEPLEHSFGTLEADRFGPSCIAARDQGPESEDCLTLNIWRPSNVAKSNVSLPVLVWLYGGSLTSGYTVSTHTADIALEMITDDGRPTLAMTLPL